jgi:hypothetical protein
MPLSAEKSKAPALLESFSVVPVVWEKGNWHHRKRSQKCSGAFLFV